MPCWHSFHLLSTHFGDNEMWQEALERKYFSGGEPFGREEFDQLLHSFAAVSSDTPAIAFAEDLIKAYPEAKVVLVERDIESWYESTCTASSATHGVPSIDSFTGSIARISTRSGRFRMCASRGGCASGATRRLSAWRGIGIGSTMSW